jgi:glycosyltransferase involved in cell wall biosynthesis
MTTPMPACVALVHNYYLRAGGEDQVFEAEARLLADHGHQVVAFTMDNRTIGSMSRLKVAAATVWNRGAQRALQQVLHDTRPQIVHFHNTFPLVSPAAYTVVRGLGLPVVQTLHNFRLLCPNALFFRDRHVCEECLHRKVAWPGIRHGCYRGSRAATTTVAAMLAVHRSRRTWESEVDVFVALSEFARQKFIAGGLPGDRIVVKPNFLPQDPGQGPHDGRFALYVGRLAPEKGVQTLLRAWQVLSPSVPLRVVGHGPLDLGAARDTPGVEWLGAQPHERVLELLRDAALLIMPTECYENFPLTVLEAFATGAPVLASRIGSVTELVREGETGLQFRAGDPEDLAEKLDWALHHPHRMREMAASAHAEYETRYSAGENYRRLSDIYSLAARHADASPAATPA